MASVATRGVVINLYRSLLKTGRSWENYNFREYILRRVKEDFTANKLETNPTRIQDLIARAQQNLGVVKRQGAIQNMYNQDKLVIEVKNKL